MQHFLQFYPKIYYDRPSFAHLKTIKEVLNLDGKCFAENKKCINRETESL